MKKQAEHPFFTFYRNQISKFERRLEAERIRTVRQILITGSLSLILPWGLFSYLMPDGQMFEDLIVIPVLVSIAGLYLCYYFHKSYSRSVKGEIFPRLVKFFGDDFKFSVTSPMSVSQLLHYHIIPYYEREQSEDYITGTVEGIKLRFFETRLTYESGSGKNRRTHVSFQGFFVEFEFPEDFPTELVLKVDLRSAGRGILSTLKIISIFSTFGSSVYQKLNKPKGMSSVRLEDPLFEKIFDAYSPDQIKARVLLNPVFMEQMTAMAKMHEGCTEASFFHRKLLVKVDSKNLFELKSVFKKLDLFKESRDFYRDIYILFQMAFLLRKK